MTSANIKEFVTKNEENNNNAYRKKYYLFSIEPEEFGESRAEAQTTVDFFLLKTVNKFCNISKF